MKVSKVMAAALLVGAGMSIGAPAQIIDRNPDSFMTPQWVPSDKRYLKKDPSPYYKKINKRREANKEAAKSRRRNRK